MLREIQDYNGFKELFAKKFQRTLNENVELRDFIYDLFVYATAYVVGGYLRDIVFEKKSRDLDMMVSLSFNEIIVLLESSNLNYKTNRFNGIKIHLKDIDVDIWSIEDNWAFQKKVVVKNDDGIINSIANGCFYNYDSLVINVHTKNLNVKGFNEFVRTRSLDIIQKNKRYKKLNPTIEANILRAFYLRRVFKIDFTENCNNYLLSRIGYLNDRYFSSTRRLLKIINQYDKYKFVLNNDRILECADYCFKSSNNPLIAFQ